MVQLAIQIEKYVGRKIDFTKEVIIIDGTITEWNIKDKTKPNTTQLDAGASASQASTISAGTSYGYGANTYYTGMPSMGVGSQFYQAYGTGGY